MNGAVRNDDIIIMIIINNGGDEDLKGWAMKEERKKCVFLKYRDVSISFLVEKFKKLEFDT